MLIATPVYLHYPMLEDALKAGKHVFCEKSLVFTADEVQKCARFIPRSIPSRFCKSACSGTIASIIRAVRQMIDKGMLGDVKFMYAQWHRNPGWVMKPGNWRLFRKTSGGLAAELGSHHFDVADWMFGSSPRW